MADNVVLDAGSGGDTVAADDIAGVKFPRGKIVIGADGVNDGDVSSANPLPVAGTGTAGTANAGVMTVQGVASMTPVQVADNGGSLTVDNAVLSVVGPGVPTSALRVALADDAAITAYINDIVTVTVEALVDSPVFVRLSDGSNAVSPALETGGNLAAAATSLGVMDDWDNAASDGASVSGDVAHDSADAGEPVKVGAKATTALSAVTLVANNDRTNLHAGVDGVQITRPHCGLEDVVTGNANNTDGTSTQCIAASGDAAIKTYLTSVVLTNTSSSNIYVELKSGTTVMATIPLPANGGAIFNPPVPLKPNAANEAWNFDPSAAASTVYCSMIGFKSKV